MNPSEKAFFNQNVIVTAGASGIGYYIAETFVNAGACVHIIDINQVAIDEARKKLEHALDKTIFTQADVSQEIDVDRVFDLHRETMGGVDVMINCAGIAGPTLPVEDVTLEQWHQCLGVNLDATFLFSRKVIPLMKHE